MFRLVYAIPPPMTYTFVATDTKLCIYKRKTQQLLLMIEKELNELLTTSEQLLAELDCFLIER